MKIGEWVITASPLEIWQVAQAISLAHFWAGPVRDASQALFTLPGSDPLGLYYAPGDVDSLRILINADWFGHMDIVRSAMHELVSIATLFTTPDMRQAAEEQIQAIFAALVGQSITVEKRWGLENIATELAHKTANPRPKKKPTGRHHIAAHDKAIERLKQGESGEQNFHKWRVDYKEETGIDPDQLKSGAREAYRGSVSRPFRKLSGKTDRKK